MPQLFLVSQNIHLLDKDNARQSEDNAENRWCTCNDRPAVAASSAICTASSSGGSPASAASAHEEDVEAALDTSSSYAVADGAVDLLAANSYIDKQSIVRAFKLRHAREARLERVACYSVTKARDACRHNTAQAASQGILDIIMYASHASRRL